MYEEFYTIHDNYMEYIESSKLIKIPDKRAIFYIYLEETMQQIGKDFFEKYFFFS